MSKLATINYQGKDYATVPVRLKEFRETNPRAEIDTTPTYNEDGSVTFKARIVADRSDESSAVATGNARYSAEEIKKTKAFEKLETIAVGRALANLGFLNNGEIATTEEMEEFNQYKQSKAEDAIETIKSSKTLDELRHFYLSLGSLMSNPSVYAAKEAKKKELSHADNRG